MAYANELEWPRNWHRYLEKITSMLYPAIKLWQLSEEEQQITIRVYLRCANLAGKVVSSEAKEDMPVTNRDDHVPFTRG
jgi:hypothetical protein